MRIGQQDNSLSIEWSPLEGGCSTLKVEAVATASGRRFTASHDRLMIECSDDTLKRFADFESLKSKHAEIPLTEGSWLRLQRDARGYITVRYRIVGWKALAAMEGEIVVEGENSGALCREIRALLEASP